MSGPVRLDLHQDGWTGGYQVSIGDDDGGFRLIGPKFNGSSTRITSHVLDEYDAAEIRRYLDKAFPPETTPVTPSPAKAGLTPPPDPTIYCEICDEECQGDDLIACPEVGMVHVACHRGSTCRDSLCAPDYEEN